MECIGALPCLLLSACLNGRRCVCQYGVVCMQHGSIRGRTFFMALATCKKLFLTRGI